MTTRSLWGSSIPWYLYRYVQQVQNQVKAAEKPRAEAAAAKKVTFLMQKLQIVLILVTMCRFACLSSWSMGHSTLYLHKTVLTLGSGSQRCYFARCDAFLTCLLLVAE